MFCLCPNCLSNYLLKHIEYNNYFFNKLEDISVEDIMLFVKETYNVNLSHKGTASNRTFAINKNSFTIFYNSFQTYIRNSKFNRIERTKNEEYPESLIKDFENYFNFDINFKE